MKIAIAAEKDDEASMVCPTAGRAPVYLIFENNELVKSIKNPFATGGGGAGYGVAKMLENEKVEMVISGSFGNNMQTALENANIKTKEITDKTIKETLKEI